MISIRKAVPFKWLRVSRLFLSTNALPKEDKMKIGKYEINYLTVGNGPHKVFCSPGAFATIWTNFQSQIEGFNRDKFSLIIWDPPGYGKSYPIEKEFTVDFFEKDADAAYQLMTRLQIPKFSVMGFSDGGTMCLNLAGKYPDAINKLVVWGCNSFILPEELETYRKMRLPENWSPWLLQSYIEQYGKERFMEYWSSWVSGMEEIFYTKNGNICADLLKNIKCPTFILNGEKDPLLDHRHIPHLLMNIRDSRIYRYPKGKHFIQVLYAKDFNKRVQEFLLEE